MKKLFLIPLLLVPLTAGAVVYPDASEPLPTNQYLLQSRINITQLVPADLVAAGGTVNVDSPVNGEVLAAGGTVSVLQGAGGDVRVAGGKITVMGPVNGDVAAAGGTIKITSTARNIYAAGGSVDVEGESLGTVTIYGANVFLSGTYSGNVSVVASNRFTLGDNTYIKGTLKYSAPQELAIPISSQIDGGARYTGANAYVPTNQQAHKYAIIGIILFFAVRVIAGSILAGLIVGLFPLFVEKVSTLVLRRDTKEVLRLLIIGLSITALTPLLCLFLLISFVGAGLAMLLATTYILLAIIAYAFSGIVAGAFIRRTLISQTDTPHKLTWQDALIGTIAIHGIGLVPYVGTFVVLIIVAICAGAIAHFAYRFAFNIR